MTFEIGKKVHEWMWVCVCVSIGKRGRESVGASKGRERECV